LVISGRSTRRPVSGFGISSDFVKDYRKGDNLYTCGVVVLDAKTGELKGHDQFVKNDFHDWDVAASPILFTSKSGRQMVAAACKNGYLYGLSRDLKDELFKTPVTRIENTEAPLTSSTPSKFEVPLVRHSLR
jgi:alcohol dehydrogenase (cytochrome c)